MVGQISRSLTRKSHFKTSYPESVIPECFYRESRRNFLTGPPMKTFGGDNFGIISTRFYFIPVRLPRGRFIPDRLCED